MIGFQACLSSLVCLLQFASILISTGFIRETVSAHIPSADCRSERIKSKELSPSFCPNEFSIALWKVCPYATSELCVEGFLSVPSIASDKTLQLRIRKKGLRSNEIFTRKRSSKTTEDGRHSFYTLQTADGKCVEVNENGYLTVSTTQNSDSCQTVFRDFISSTNILAASPKRICALHQSKATPDRAYVLRFNEYGEQNPLLLQNPSNCTRALKPKSPSCKNGSDVEVDSLLGITYGDIQTTAFRVFYDLASNQTCHSILSHEIQDCCNLQKKCS